MFDPVCGWMGRKDGMNEAGGDSHSRGVGGEDLEKIDRAEFAKRGGIEIGR